MISCTLPIDLNKLFDLESTQVAFHFSTKLSKFIALEFKITAISTNLFFSVFSSLQLRDDFVYTQRNLLFFLFLVPSAIGSKSGFLFTWFFAQSIGISFCFCFFFRFWYRSANGYIKYTLQVIIFIYKSVNVNFTFGLLFFFSFSAFSLFT